VLLSKLNLHCHKLFKKIFEKMLSDMVSQNAVIYLGA
jgi:hypothetical protein